MYTKTITFKGQPATLSWEIGEEGDDYLFEVTETIVSEEGETLATRVFMATLDTLTSFPTVYTQDEDR